MDNNAANSLYNLLVTRDFEPKATKNGEAPTNDQGKEDISAANMFSFDYKTPNKNYGTVVILLGDKNNMIVFYGDNVGRAMEGADKQEWYQFLEQLKHFAMRNMLKFELDNISKLKYTMQGMAAIKEGLFEGYYGKKNISYSDQPKQVRLMIKHSRDIKEGEARYRAIESLFVETADGERFRVPSRSLMHGRMIARHCAEGGTPYDAFGNHINEIVSEMATMARFIRAAKHKPFTGEAAELVEAAVRHYSDLKAKAKQMISQRGYHEARESFDPAEITNSSEVAESIRTMFIEQTLDSRIEEALPILAKLKETPMREADEFESWSNRIMEGEDRVDSLVTKGLEKMTGPRWLDAVAAIKAQVGERDYRDRKQFYDVFVRQLVDMYGKKQQGMAEGSDISTSTLTGEIPTLMGNRKKEQRDLIEKYALHNREQDYFELFVELSGKPMSEIYNMNDSHRLANELYNLGSQIASDWRNISNPTFSRREYLNQIMSDWYNLFKKSIQKYKSMNQGMAEGMEDSSVASSLTRRIMSQRLDLLKKYGPVKVMAAIDDAADHFGEPDEIGSSDSYAHMQYVEKALSGMNEQGVAEEINKTTYAEELAEKLFDDMPNLQNQDDIIRAGYVMAKKDSRLVGRVDGIFRDEDFPSDFVSVYRYIQHNHGIRNGVEEDLDTDGVMMTKPSNMSSESATLDLERLKRLALM